MLVSSQTPAENSQFLSTSEKNEERREREREREGLGGNIGFMQVEHAMRVAYIGSIIILRRSLTPAYALLCEYACLYIRNALRQV